MRKYYTAKSTQTSQQKKVSNRHQRVYHILVLLFGVASLSFNYEHARLCGHELRSKTALVKHEFNLQYVV